MGIFRLGSVGFPTQPAPPFATAALQVLEIGLLFLPTCALHWRKAETLIRNFITGQDTSGPSGIWLLVRLELHARDWGQVLANAAPTIALVFTDPQRAGGASKSQALTVCRYIE